MMMVKHSIEQPDARTTCQTSTMKWIEHVES
jgi:hypothetical protein